MRIRDGYMIRRVADMHVVIGIGSGNYAPDRIMSLNDAVAFLWGLMEQDTDPEMLTEALTGEYNVDPETARKDVEVFLNDVRKAGLLAE